MPPQNNLDRIRIVFGAHGLVANAGLLLRATLAQHLGLRALGDHHLDLDLGGEGCFPPDRRLQVKSRPGLAFFHVLLRKG